MSIYDEETSWYPMKGLILSWSPWEKETQNTFIVSVQMESH
jgi:hypothetical protein